MNEVKYEHGKLCTQQRAGKDQNLSCFKENTQRTGGLFQNVSCNSRDYCYIDLFSPFRLTELLFFLLQNNDIIYYNAKDDQNDVSNMFHLTTLPVISKNQGDENINGTLRLSFKDSAEAKKHGT